MVRDTGFEPVTPTVSRHRESLDLLGFFNGVDFVATFVATFSLRFAIFCMFYRGKKPKFHLR